MESEVLVERKSEDRANYCSRDHCHREFLKWTGLKIFFTNDRQLTRDDGLSTWMLDPVQYPVAYSNDDQAVADIADHQSEKDRKSQCKY